MGKLADVIQAEFGFQFRAEFPPKPVTLVANEVVQILKANPDRVSWDMFNLGNIKVLLSHDPVPSVTNGYYLDKDGGHIGMVWNEDGELVAYPIYAVSTVTPTIFVKAVVGK
ncbi:unnamed protein product [marine sediment metagenome]|uniref:Uncharacterized protein n=1 Tax=marine sediment metagenome TaxID=412755 RepID=X1TPZ0_9ZZZZ